MSFLGLFLVAMAVSMDATAVAAARGLAAARVRARDVALVAGAFGFAQGFMPLLGWLAGDRLGPFFAAVDHWVAFAVLAGVGGKMAWEGRHPPGTRPTAQGDPFAWQAIVLLAFATSLDAFAVGVTLPTLGIALPAAVITIASTTAALSAAGVLLGRRFGAGFGGRLEVLGGFTLIGLGVKILLEHLLA